MAKAYITQSKRIGSVGGETYSVVNGQTIVRAKPVSVANPRTDAQMTQRSQFLSAVRFFQRANQRFFKFAFESKKQTESDYNAFMRLNSKRGGYITKAQGDSIGFPMVAPWIMTQGSLGGLTYDIYLDEENNINYLSVTLAPSFSGTAPTTIAGISEQLKANYTDVLESDIITLLSIHAADVGTSFIDDLDAADIENENIWILNQFLVDTTDTRAIGEVLNNATCAVRDGALFLDIRISDHDSVGGGIAVQSRNTPSGLKVSNTVFALNATGLLAYDMMRSNAHREQVLAWWGAQQQAILQGALSQPVDTSAIPKITGIGTEGNLLPVAYNISLDFDDSEEVLIYFDGVPSSEIPADYFYVGGGKQGVELRWRSVSEGQFGLSAKASTQTSSIGAVPIYYKDGTLIWMAQVV